MGLATVLAGAVVSGIGYWINRQVEADRTDLSVLLSKPIQAVPLSGKNPTWNSIPVGCEVVRAELTLAHNQNGKLPILVRSLGVETEPVSLDATASRQLAYEVDELSSTPHGIVKVREYRLVLESNKITGTYVRSRNAGDVVQVEPENILRTVEGSEGITLAPTSPDAHYPINIVLETRTAGFYKTRFLVVGQVGKEERKYYTDWIYLYRKAD